MRELHQKLYPNLMLGYFIDEYCNKILEDNCEIYRVDVIITDEYKYQYRKRKMEIVK